MHRLPVHHRGRAVGSLAVPEQFRLPLSQIEISMFNMIAWTIMRSRSWLFIPRAGDFKLELVGGELAIVAGPRICPGDLSLLEGFEASAEGYESDPEIEAVATEVARQHGLGPNLRPL
jgi:hypothetical protein